MTNWRAMTATCAAAVATAAGLTGPPAAMAALSPVIPWVKCILPEVQPGQTLVRYGYSNNSSSTITYRPEGPNNFMQPYALTPSVSTFLPGFQLDGAQGLVGSADGATQTWFLGSSAITANTSRDAGSYQLTDTSGTSRQVTVPAAPTCGPTPRGTWSSATTYYPNDVVQDSGASWLATAISAGTAPAAGPSWTLLAAAGKDGATGARGATGLQGPTGATGDRGPAGTNGASGPQGEAGPQGAPGAAGDRGATGATGAQGDAGAQGAPGPQGAPGAAGERGATGERGSTGEQGERGAAGLPGPAGPQGAPGAAGATASSTIERFDRRGRVTVRDAGVNAASVVVVQYADPSRRTLRPTNIRGVRDGSFQASGQPGARFRYVVYRP